MSLICSKVFLEENIVESSNSMSFSSSTIFICRFNLVHYISAYNIENNA